MLAFQDYVGARESLVIGGLAQAARGELDGELQEMVPVSPAGALRARAAAEADEATAIFTQSRRGSYGCMTGEMAAAEAGEATAIFTQSRRGSYGC